MINFAQFLCQLREPSDRGEIPDAFVALFILSNPKIRNALLANPFIHGTHAFSAPDKADNYAGFALNAARFGNLENPQVVSVLKEVLSNDTGANGVLKTGPVFRALTRRPDLPEDLVQTLGRHPGSDIADHYLELVNNAAHQRLVLSGKITIGKMMKAGTLKQWVFSPALDSSEIEGIYDAGGDNDNTLLASFLYAAKCPERIYREIKPKMHLLGIPNFLRRSPWAKTHIEEIPRAKFFAKLQDELLDWQADDSEKLDCLAIPAIPFNGIHPDDLTETFKKDGELAAALVIGATRDREFAKRLLHADVSREDGVAIMFVPYASGRQLEKAVAGNPELAALAACHTNGGDILLMLFPKSNVLS